MNLSKAIQELKDQASQAGIEAKSGLGTDLFHFASTLMPVVNVDLIILNKNGQVLLSWRDDPYTGVGWHIPGCCVRFKERLEEAVQRCAVNEIGAHVTCEEQPCELFQIICNGHREIVDQDERAHFITLSYRCSVSEDYQINNGAKKETDPGYLKWFDELPEVLLPGHECYRYKWDEIVNWRKQSNVEK